MDEIGAHAVEARVHEYCERNLPALALARVVLAASGGGDSAATVALLCETRLIDRRCVVVAHFDHRLRGRTAAERDLAAVRALCARYGLALETSAWDQPRAGEAAAREARYGFLAGVARSHDARGIITGHTSDDQVETVLMHALRGAGLRGFSGMAAAAALPPVRVSDRGAADVQVWRPLLCATREETRGYCALRGIAYVDDPSNSDTRFGRNRIRAQLLPQLEEGDPNTRVALLRLAACARVSVAAIDAVADTAIIEGAEMSSEVWLSRETLLRLPAEAVPYAYRLAIVQLLGDARDIDRRHYRLLAGAASATTGSAFELPRGIVATVDATAIVLSVGQPGPVPIAEGLELVLPFAGDVGAWSVAITRAGLNTDDHHVCVSRPSGESAALTLPPGCVLRGRRPGDRITLRGGGHRKLQDVYVDAKTPRRERDAAPVIAVGADVLWSPLVPRSIAPARTGAAYRVVVRRRESLRERT